MADQTITIVGSSSYGPTATTERPISTTSAVGTLAGHYILVFASIDYPVATTDPDIAAVAGVTWSSPIEATDTTTMRSRMWLGQVTTNGQKTVTVNGTSGKRLYVHAYTLDPGSGGVITVDGTSSTISTETPSPVAVSGLNYTFTHKTVTAAGTKDLLVAFLSAFQSGQTSGLNMGAAVAPMTVGQSVAVSGSTRTQSVYQQLTAGGDIGTRQQQWTLSSAATLSGAAGIMAALRSQVADVTPAAPTVNAGADAGTTVNSAFLRTATESANNSAITARAWTIVSGPVGTGSTIGTAAALSWTPTTTGAYVLRYSATNGVGTSTDDVAVNVTTAVGTATVTNQWLGIGSVVFKTAGTSTVRVGFSTSSGMSGAVFSSAQTPSNGVTKHTFPTLTPGTTYWYQAEQDGGFIGTAYSFMAPPAADVATSFTFACGSCLGSDQSPVRDFPLASDVSTRGSRFFLQMGDIHYANINSTNAATYRTAWDDVVFGSARPQMKSLMRSVPMAYVYDDHDFCGDNSYGASTGRATAQQVFRERVPHPTLPSATGGVYQTFVMGRVRIIMLDCRGYRSNPENADDGSKTMLGSEQKTWLTNLLPTITQPLTFIVSSVTWHEVQTAPSATNTDAWGKYTTERAQLITLLQSASNTKIAFLCGDWHGLAIDDGTNAAGRFPTYIAAAMQQYGNGLRGGPVWSGGSRATVNNSESQYGTIDITDDGVNISWKFTGILTNASPWGTHEARTIESGRMMLGM